MNSFSSVCAVYEILSSINRKMFVQYQNLPKIHFIKRAIFKRIIKEIDCEVYRQLQFAEKMLSSEYEIKKSTN